MSSGEGVVEVGPVCGVECSCALVPAGGAAGGAAEGVGAECEDRGGIARRIDIEEALVDPRQAVARGAAFALFGILAVIGGEPAARALGLLVIVTALLELALARPSVRVDRERRRVRVLQAVNVAGMALVVAAVLVMVVG